MAGSVTTDAPQKGIWKSAKGKGRRTPKGRQLDDVALGEVQEVLGSEPRARDLLIEFLHLIQDAHGHLSHRHLRALAHEMRLSMAEVYEVATFYAHFDVVGEDEAPPPEITVRVCDSLSCEMAGAQKLLAALAAEHGDGARVRVLRAPCMGRCDTAPVAEVGHRHVGHADVAKIGDVISDKDFAAEIPDYVDFPTYFDGGGYQALRALRAEERSIDDLQDELLEAGLRGFGGAGFPSGRKWSFVRAEDGPRYLAVNGDEGEPGTFKDRLLLETEPHRFLDGALIAALAIKAAKVFIYIRDEYPAAINILKTEITELVKAGLVAPGYLDVRRGAGAYICGEESAMIESIEGKRGLPRHRPPYVAQVGVFGRPTLVHNVETLHWVAQIAQDGPQVLNSVEKNGRIGLRRFSVSGRVKEPGVKLLPAGSTILDIIEASGGMLDGHTFTAYQPGGPSSGLLPAALNDVPLDFDTLQPHGSFIGSAAVVVLSDKDDPKAAALNMLRFFEDESCGQCTPCRVGCEKAVKLMAADNWDRAVLGDLCEAMEAASICGLGQAAPNAIRLTLKHFIGKD